MPVSRHSSDRRVGSGTVFVIQFAGSCTPEAEGRNLSMWSNAGYRPRAKAATATSDSSLQFRVPLSSATSYMCKEGYNNTFILALYIHFHIHFTSG